MKEKCFSSEKWNSLPRSEKTAPLTALSEEKRPYTMQNSAVTRQPRIGGNSDGRWPAEKRHVKRAAGLRRKPVKIKALLRRFIAVSVI